jgi:hypothetical protein
MNPGAYTNLQIVNATAQDLVNGTNPPPGIPSFSAYQMYGWFNYPAAPPYPLVPAKTAIVYPIQALEGVGDEDDAANLLVNLDDPGNADANIFYLYAGSDSDSAHYVQAVPLAPSGPLLVLGAYPDGPLPSATAAAVQWSTTLVGELPISLGVMPLGDQALVVADLAVLFPLAQAVTIFDDIQTKQVSAADQQALFSAVVQFVT